MFLEVKFFVYLSAISFDLATFNSKKKFKSRSYDPYAIKLHHVIVLPVP